MTEPKIDDIIKVTHSRKGTFKIKVTHVSDDWISGEITEGTAKKFRGSVNWKGEDVALRRSFMTIHPQVTS